MTHSGKVGAFEGATYQAKGLYRPQTDCIMFTRDEVGFCKVCRKGHRARDRPLLEIGDTPLLLTNSSRPHTAL